MDSKKTFKKRPNEDSYHQLRKALKMINARITCSSVVAHESMEIEYPCDGQVGIEVPLRTGEVLDTHYHQGNIDVDDYTQERFQGRLTSEYRKQPLLGYIEINQKNLSQKMRSVLVDWLVAVADEYELHQETLLLSTGYVDRFLSKEGGKNLPKSKFQLVGVTAMLIASKYEEPKPLEIEDLVFITDYAYSRRDILDMELRILKALLFEVCQPTVTSFFPYLLTTNYASFTDSEGKLVAALCSYLAEIAVLNYKTATKFLPSQIAFSCLLLANHMLFSNNRCLQSFTGCYGPSQLKRICVLIYTYLKNTTRSQKLPAIREKYSGPRFLFIAQHPAVLCFINTFQTLPSFVFTEVLNKAQKTTDIIEFLE
jgi:cyclin A